MADVIHPVFDNANPETRFEALSVAERAHDAFTAALLAPDDCSIRVALNNALNYLDTLTKAAKKGAQA